MPLTRLPLTSRHAGAALALATAALLTACSSGTATPVASTPVASTPVASTPVASSPVASTPAPSPTGAAEAKIADVAGYTAVAAPAEFSSALEKTAELVPSVYIGVGSKLIQADGKDVGLMAALEINPTLAANPTFEKAAIAGIASSFGGKGKSTSVNIGGQSVQKTSTAGSTVFVWIRKGTLIFAIGKTPTSMDDYVAKYIAAA